MSNLPCPYTPICLAEEIKSIGKDIVRQEIIEGLEHLFCTVETAKDCSICAGLSTQTWPLKRRELVKIRGALEACQLPQNTPKWILGRIEKSVEVPPALGGYASQQFGSAQDKLIPPLMPSEPPEYRFKE